MYIEDKDIHKGHRARMKSKLQNHGARIFDTYELLEMLLYYAVPYKDTNPIAKRLLARFGSLEGVLDAEREELMSVDGIGEYCADFIRLARRVKLENDALEFTSPIIVFDNYRVAGEYVCLHFATTDSKICILLLDNGMRLIGVKDIPGDSFSSGGVKAKHFIDATLNSRATIVIIAHHNVHGPLFPTESDMATDKLIRTELSALGVVVAEHYVVCGKRYMGIKADLSLNVSASSPELEKFRESKAKEDGGVSNE